MGAELTLTGITAPTVTISPAAHEARRVALAAAATCTEVVDLASQVAASQAQAAAKNLLKQVEESRALIKAPVIEAGKLIDATAAAFVADLIKEERRLSLLVGAYQDAERRKAQAATAETYRKEQQRLEAAKREERTRASQEIAGRTGTLLPDLQNIRQRAADDIAGIRQTAVNAATAAPSGSITRTNWKFEVTDIHALHAAHPDLCTIEPNGAAIRAIIKHNQKIPGLRIWSETASVVTTRSQAALPAAVDKYDY